MLCAMLNILVPPSCSHTILVFPSPNGMAISTGTPLSAASNARGTKNHDFRPKSRFISETIQYRAIVTGRRIGNRVLKLSNGIGFNDLE